MGLLPKERPSYKPLSPEMKAEVRKMKRYSNQIRLIIKEKLETIQDVEKYISKTKEEIESITTIRQKYRNKLRNCKDETLINEYKSQISDCSSILKKCRTNIKIANQIIEDIPKIKETIKIEKQMKSQELEKETTKKKNRYKER